MFQIFHFYVLGKGKWGRGEKKEVSKLQNGVMAAGWVCGRQSE